LKIREAPDKGIWVENLTEQVNQINTLWGTWHLLTSFGIGGGCERDWGVQFIESWWEATSCLQY
jgi:hypothetical protein